MDNLSGVKKVNIDDISIGDNVSFSKIITLDDVEKFATLSGDNNPIHLDENYAKKSRFKKRIVHGLMLSSYFSGLFGTKLPGEGCVYVSQNLQFKRPVYIGDYVTAVITVEKIDIINRRVLFKTQCIVKNKVVIDGNAEIFIPKEKLK